MEECSGGKIDMILQTQHLVKFICICIVLSHYKLYICSLESYFDIIEII